MAKFLEQHYSKSNPLLVHLRELAETAVLLAERVNGLVQKAETEVFRLLNFWYIFVALLSDFPKHFVAVKIPIGLLVKQTQLDC